MTEPTQREKHALVAAAAAFEEHGIEFPMPWEGDLDDLERERYAALLQACRAYDSEMKRWHSR